MANPTHSISTTITKLVGPDAEEVEVPVCVSASITPPDRSVGIDGYGWEDLTVTDANGEEVTIDEAMEESLGEKVVDSYVREDADMYMFARKGGDPDDD